MIKQVLPKKILGFIWKWFLTFYSIDEVNKSLILKDRNFLGQMKYLLFIHVGCSQSGENVYIEFNVTTNEAQKVYEYCYRLLLPVRLIWTHPCLIHSAIRFWTAYNHIQKLCTCIPCLPTYLLYLLDSFRQTTLICALDLWFQYLWTSVFACIYWEYKSFFYIMEKYALLTH